MPQRIPLKTLFSTRSLFIMSLFVALILLPVLSLNAGISGDEPIHYEQGRLVNEYFKSGKTNLAALETPTTNLKYYGQVLDNVSFYINETFNVKKPYVIRHLINSLCGALIIIFSALIATSIGGYKAGILTVLFLFLSPRFLGHCFNNLKDIPFALGYVLSIWGIIRCMQLFPKFKIKPLLGITLGLSLAFGTRAGGLIIIPFVYLFIGSTWVTHHLTLRQSILTDWRKSLFNISILTLALFLGYFLGLLYWPFGRLNIFSNPVEALKIMTHYKVSIRQVFDGVWYWSENLPWYYAVKYILITTPIVILAGFVIQFKAIRKNNYLIFLALNFTVIFPLVWVIIKASNLYGGWRHLLFIYPVLTIIAALFWSNLFSSTKTWVHIISYLILAIGLSGPFYHIIRNHPVEYVYFNYPSGGIKAANGKYEMDYYFHSLGPATKWIRKYLNEHHKGETIRLASNFDLHPYFTDCDNIETVYIHYYNRGKTDWDYGLFVSNYLYPSQLRNDSWPPQNTIHTITVSGVPLCAIIKRTTKEDLAGYRSYKAKDYLNAIEHLQKALIADNDNETSRLYEAWAYRQTGNYETSDSLAKTLLYKIPGYDTGIDLLGRNQLSEGHFRHALSYFNFNISSNYKYLPAYKEASLAHDSLGEYSEAAHLLERGYSLGLRDSTSIVRLIGLLNKMGNHSKARQFRLILNKK